VLPGIVEWGKVVEPLLQRLETLACEQPKREARRAALMGGAGTGSVYGGEFGFNSDSTGERKDNDATAERLKDFQAGLDSRAEIAALALQLAPLLERWGRILVDLAPSVEALAHSPTFVPQSVDIQHSLSGLSEASDVPSSPAPPFLTIPTYLEKHAQTHATRQAVASGYCSLTRFVPAEPHWSSMRLPGYALPSQDGTTSLLRSSSHTSGSGLATLGALLGGAVDVVALLEGIIRLEAAAAAAVGAASNGAGGGDTYLSGGLVDDPSPCNLLLTGGDPTGDVLGVGSQVEEEEEEVEESDAK